MTFLQYDYVRKLVEVFANEQFLGFSLLVDIAKNVGGCDVDKNDGVSLVRHRLLPTLQDRKSDHEVMKISWRRS